MDEKYAKHIDELVEAIGSKASREEIEEEFSKYVDDFKVSVGVAKDSIAKKYGASINGFSREAEEKTLAEIMPGENNVTVLARIVFAAKKDVKVKGEDTTIYSGILGDNTKTMPFTLWEVPDGLELEKGEVVKIENAYTTEYKDEPQINLGQRAILTKLDRDALPPRQGSNGGINLAGKPTMIGELAEGVRNATVTGRVLDVETREVMVKGEPRDVTSGTMADDTGKISFTCWGKTDFGVGDIIEARETYIRYWRGMPQLNFDSTKVSRSEAELPDAEELARPAAATIDQISRSNGMLDAMVNGVVLDVREGSGLIFRCPECNRVVKKNVCKLHGEVEGEPDLRVKAVVDDGTGALNVIIGREATERILAKSLDACLKEAKKAMDHGVIRDQLFDLMVARPMEIIGNVTSDDFGLMMISNNADFLTLDVEEEARRMLEVI